MRERAAYGSIKERFSSFAVGEIRAAGPEMSWSTIRSTATRMRKEYGTSFGVYKLNKSLSVVRLS